MLKRCLSSAQSLRRTRLMSSERPIKPKVCSRTNGSGPDSGPFAPLVDGMASSAEGVTPTRPPVLLCISLTSVARVVDLPEPAGPVRSRVLGFPTPSTCAWSFSRTSRLPTECAVCFSIATTCRYRSNSAGAHSGA